MPVEKISSFKSSSLKRFAREAFLAGSFLTILIGIAWAENKLPYKSIEEAVIQPGGFECDPQFHDCEKMKKSLADLMVKTGPALKPRDFGFLRAGDVKDLSTKHVYGTFIYSGEAGELVSVEVASADVSVKIQAADAYGTDFPAREHDATGGQYRALFSLPLSGNYHFMIRPEHVMTDSVAKVSLSVDRSAVPALPEPERFEVVDTTTGAVIRFKMVGGEYMSAESPCEWNGKMVYVGCRAEAVDLRRGRVNTCRSVLVVDGQETVTNGAPGRLQEVGGRLVYYDANGTLHFGERHWPGPEPASDLVSVGDDLIWRDSYLTAVFRNERQILDDPDFFKVEQGRVFHTKDEKLFMDGKLIWEKADSLENVVLVDNDVAMEFNCTPYCEMGSSCPSCSIVVYRGKEIIPDDKYALISDIASWDGELAYVAQLKEGGSVIVKGGREISPVIRGGIHRWRVVDGVSAYVVWSEAEGARGMRLFFDGKQIGQEYSAIDMSSLRIVGGRPVFMADKDPQGSERVAVYGGQEIGKKGARVSHVASLGNKLVIVFKTPGEAGPVSNIFIEE